MSNPVELAENPLLQQSVATDRLESITMLFLGSDFILHQASASKRCKATKRFAVVQTSRCARGRVIATIFDILPPEVTHVRLTLDMLQPGHQDTAGIPRQKSLAISTCEPKSDRIEISTTACPLAIVRFCTAVTELPVGVKEVGVNHLPQSQHCKLGIELLIPRREPLGWQTCWKQYIKIA